jgi:hypothetical protein
VDACLQECVGKPATTAFEEATCLPSSVTVSIGARTSRNNLELELILSQMTQKPMLRGEVGARALRNPVEEGGGGGCMAHTSERGAA